MKPYYEDEAAGITIYHGDCLSVLSDLDVPFTGVLMDPPYASGARTEAKRTSSGSMVRGHRWAAKPIQNDQMTTPGFVWLMREVLLAIEPMLQDGGPVLSFIDWRQWPTLLGAVESVNLRVNGMVVWDKGSMGLGNGYRAQHELILFASKGVPAVLDRSVGNVLTYPREANSEHPSPKPVALMRRLLSVVAGPGSMIVDPFMGCGPTLEAARQLGAGAVGIESEEKYCEIAAKRLAQQTLFPPQDPPR